VIQPVEAVVLASGVFNNARLLMLSRSASNALRPPGRERRETTQPAPLARRDFFQGKPQNNFMGAGGLGMASGDFAGDLGGLMVLFAAA
jgi:hypothetical protein